ncbi:MAG: major outer membrane protein [Campylobacteraceae bacterium]|jgi:hypothetical protein|nr:major outer membrane protein [Campylobacteraceae bacterium]
MKQARLSLCAFIAIGALSQLNAETSLEETLRKAVENVKISGFARTTYKASKAGSADTSESLRYSGQLNVLYKNLDDLHFGATLAADGYNYPSSAASVPMAGYTASNNKGLYVDRFYLKYLINDFELIGGKYDIISPWTERGYNSSRGNGLSALYNGIQNWTFAGLVFLQTNGFDDTNLGVDLGSNHNYYAAGVTGNLKDIGLDVQLWTGAYENVLESMIYTDIRYTIGGFRVRGQANYAKINTRFASSKGIAGEKGIYYGLELRYVHDLFWLKGIYTKNDKDQPFYTVDGDNGGFLTSGEYEAINIADAARYSITVGKNFGDLRLEGSYTDFDNGTISSNGESVEIGYRYKKVFDASLELGYKTKTLADGEKVKTKTATLEMYYFF